MDVFSFAPDDFVARQAAVEAHLRAFTTNYFGLEPEGEGVPEAVAGILAGLHDLPDEEQRQAVDQLASYIHSDQAGEVLLLRGSAGTGKTSLMRGLVHYLQQLGRTVFLLAPTGRAAKVLAARTGRYASTVHRQIYLLEERLDKGGQLSGFDFLLKHFESEEPAIFVVDEASMVNSLPTREGQYQMNGLLPDLLQHVFSASGWNRLILVGDPFQLPPVHEIESAALRRPRLEALGLKVREIDLLQVKRQGRHSGILQFATGLRDAVARQQAPEELEPDQADVLEVQSTDAALELYLDLYRRDPESVVFITYSNFWAHRLNQRIRKALHPDAGPMPMPGEQLMVVRNHFLKNRDFIANGEQLLLEAHQDELEEYAGMQWLKAEFSYSDLKGHRQYLRARMYFDLLNSKSPSMGASEWQTLWRARRHAETYGTYDPYLNALQLKYAYAITGHKAQGGEWPHVFVLLEKAYGGEQQHLRWLYTAVTRASAQLYLVKAV